MKFEMTEKESTSAREWIKEHNKTCTYLKEHENEPYKGIPTLGEHYYYKFIPTGLGPCIEVGCLFCKEYKDITDVSIW